MAHAKIERLNKDPREFVVEVSDKKHHFKYTLMTRLKIGYIENAIVDLLEELEEATDEQDS
jgi:hypothetical protein